MHRRVSVAVVLLAFVTLIIVITNDRSGGPSMQPLAVPPSGLVSCTNYGGTNTYAPALYSTGVTPFVARNYGASGTCSNTFGDHIAYAVATGVLHSVGPNTCPSAGNVSHPTGMPIAYGGPNRLTIHWYATNPITGARESFTSTSTILIADYSNGVTETETWTINGGTDAGLVNQTATLTDTVGAPADFAARCLAGSAGGGLFGNQGINGTATA